MSADQRKHPEFRGGDIDECERFITAVTRHAHAEGKLRDDEWIADFVATCLTGEVVIWWSLLDRETQGSWYLLRQAMISRIRPSFYGKSGAEAENFIHQIRQRALYVGKLNDPRWIAEFASPCFVGSALRWYTSLERSVRDGWDSLQQAIFTQYDQGFEEDSKASIIPAPASAATPPVLTRNKHRGRIQVRRQDNSAEFYLSKTVLWDENPNSDEPGRIMVTTAIAEALEVEYEPASVSDGPHALIIPDNQLKGYNWLGMKWSREAESLFEDSNYLAACGLNSSSRAVSVGSAYTGPVLATPWKISSTPNEQGARSMIGMNESGQRFFTVSTRGSLKFLWFKQTKSRWEIDLELFFVPI